MRIRGPSRNNGLCTRAKTDTLSSRSPIGAEVSEMASTNPQDRGGDAKGRLPSRRRARRSLLPALTLALLAASVPVAWIVTGDTVTVQQAAVDQPEFTEEPSEF